MGKLLLLVNIGLFLILGYSFYDLYGIVNSEGERKSKKIDYHVDPIKRPVVNTYSQYRNIFGLRAGEAPIAVNTGKDKSNSNKGGVLNELRDGSLTVRVDGIFIAEGNAYAVISFKDGNSKKWVQKKIIIGDKIKGYSVTDIRPGYVSLKNRDANIITIRMFKRDET